MQLYSYNEELVNATGQLLDIFNNVTIRRLDRTSGTYVTINVPCKLGSRQRMLKSLENRNATLKPPMISLSMSNISLDRDRIHSVNDVLQYQTGDSINMIHNVATPVRISYEMSIVTKYHRDMDQILSNFIAIMNPDVYITWPNPKGQGNLKEQVVWSGDVSLESPEEISDTEPERFIASTSFEVKGWIFPGYDADTGSESRITKINFPGVYGGGAPVTGVTSAEIAMGRWYDVRDYDMPMNEFIDAISGGLIESPNYDELGYLDALSGSYWLTNIYAVLSGDIYDFTVSGDLVTLIANADNEDLIVTTIRDDATFFTPETLTSADWGSIWRRMLSGDLSLDYTSSPLSSQTYKYLIKDESYMFLLYQDFSLIPIVT